MNDGRTNRCEADFEPVVNGSWHPSEYAIGDAASMAAEMIGGEEAKASALGIEAITAFVPGDKWSCQFDGKLMRSGQQIGTFSARTSYRFD